MSAVSRRLASAACALVIVATPRALVGQWAAQPGTTVHNEFGPDLGIGASRCRGACGPDCPPTCETSERWECVGKHSFRVVQIFDCPTHQGCRDHDDCLDECSRRYPGSTRGPGDPLSQEAWTEFHAGEPWRSHGRNFYYGECSRRCHGDCVLRYGLARCQPWTKGEGISDGRSTFEYSQDSPGGPDRLYRCPPGTHRVCAAGVARCEPGDPAEEPPEDVRAVGVFVGPEIGCVERGEAVQLWAVVHGFANPLVVWSANGPGSVDQSGRLRATGEGVVRVRASLYSPSSLYDEIDIRVGHCDCVVRGVVSGDTRKSRIVGNLAHFSTRGMATIIGAFTNPQALESTAETFSALLDGAAEQATLDEWRREQSAGPQETLGISLVDGDLHGGDAALVGMMVGGFKLQASVMNEPIRPGFTGALPLGHVYVVPGDWDDTLSDQVRYQWLPGAPGYASLVVSQYTGRSLSGTISGHLYGQGVRKTGGGVPQIQFTLSFHALEFDPLGLALGCVATD